QARLAGVRERRAAPDDMEHAPRLPRTLVLRRDRSQETRGIARPVPDEKGGVLLERPGRQPDGVAPDDRLAGAQDNGGKRKRSPHLARPPVEQVHRRRIDARRRDRRVIDDDHAEDRVELTGPPTRPAIAPHGRSIPPKAVDPPREGIGYV